LEICRVHAHEMPKANQKRPARPLAPGSAWANANAAAGVLDSDALRDDLPRQDQRLAAYGNFGVESDLSSDMAVGDRELDAITRLLGDELEKLFSGTH
jgi:hypothetical protein